MLAAVGALAGLFLLMAWAVYIAQKPLKMTDGAMTRYLVLAALIAVIGLVIDVRRHRAVRRKQEAFASTGNRERSWSELRKAEEAQREAEQAERDRLRSEQKRRERAERRAAAAQEQSRAWDELVALHPFSNEMDAVFVETDRGVWVGGMGVDLFTVTDYGPGFIELDGVRVGPDDWLFSLLGFERTQEILDAMRFLGISDTSYCPLPPRPSG